MINFFDLFSVDTLYIVLGLAGVSLITLILAIVALCKAAKLKKKYRSFMEGADGKSIESLIHEHLDEIESIRTVGEKNSAAVKDIYEKMQYTFQKVGIVKYDAFHEMGGKLSFALCMLDKVNNGYIINVMHSNNGCFATLKRLLTESRTLSWAMRKTRHYSRLWQDVWVMLIWAEKSMMRFKKMFP